MNVSTKQKILRLRVRAISIIVVFAMIFGVLMIVNVPKIVKAEDYSWTIVSYNWVDISSTGTVIWQNTSVDDGYAGPFSIGFNFTFYGNSYNQVYVGSNGYITFGYGTGTIPWGFPPSYDSPDNSIMPFGYDMYVRGGITAVYCEQLTSPHRFIIQYNQLDYYSASGNYQTFQIILYTNGDIITQYQTVDLDGGNPYVGIENSNGTAGVNYTATLSNNLAIKYSFVKFEHDIAVENLQAPNYLEPGGSTYINATIRNAGLNNETNILVNFTVDGTVMDNTTISFLETGNSTIVSFVWTPYSEGNYTIGIEAAPIPNENYTGNNQQSKIVRVRYCRGFVLFDQTHGTDGISYYSDWVDSLVGEGYVVDTHTAGAIDSSIFEGYDVFVIPQARSTYTTDELSAIQSFVSSGGGLFVIGDDYPYIYSDLTGFSGINWVSGGTSGTTTDITPHEITAGVSSVYLDSPISEMTVSGSAIDLVRDPFGGIMLAVSEDPGRVAGFADEGPLQNWGINQVDNLILADNIIEWLVGIKYEHDIAVTNLQAPNWLEPGESTFVNATIRNSGLNNETNILVNFTVDGAVMDSVTISFLESGDSTPVSFSWTPMVEGIYTVGIEAAPIPNENYTGNNQQSKIVRVRYCRGFVLFDQTHGTDSISYFSDWVDSLVGKGYVVDTHTAGVIDPSTFAGYDVFVIPQAHSTYTRDEISAIQSFVSSGGGLFVIGDDNPSLYSYLTGFAEIYWDYWWWSGTTTDITPHQITTGVSSVYLDSPEAKILLSGDAIDLVRDPAGSIMLAVSEDPGRVAGFADERSLRNWGIDQADNLLLANNIIEWLVGIKYEHDIAVTNLQAPNWLEPGESTFVDATIRNSGLNNETNILVNFTVDGVVTDSTTISFLENGNSTIVSFPWTPMVEGNYTVGIEAAPVPDENYTGNNQQSEIVSVRYCKGFVLFDQTHGTDGISYYSDWVDSLLGEGYVVDTHTAGVIDPSTFVGYDVFVIPQAHSTYTMDEISAVQSFVSNGGGLFVIGDDYPYIYSDLTGFSGINWISGGMSGTTTDITPHEITASVSSVYLSSPMSEMTVSGSAIDLVRDPVGGIMLAVSENPGRVAGFTDENSLRNGGINQADNLILADNIIEWLVGIKYEHDISVTNLQSPNRLDPGQSTFVNATIRNSGLNNETNILVNFTIDGVVMDSTTISFLETGNSTIVSFPWTPMVEGIYTVGIEAAPVPNENYTGNNNQTKVVYVRYCKGFVLFDQTHGTDGISYYSDWVDSLLGEGYVVDTHTAGVIDPSTFVGYDVFVIPQARSTYTRDEISAIQSFVSNGGGLFVIGDDYPNRYSYLTGFAGIYWCSGWTSGTTTDITPHQITTGVSSVYLYSPETKIMLCGDAIDLVRDPAGSIMLAVSENLSKNPGRVAGFADEDSLRNWGINQADNLLLANNIIEWLAELRYEHDITVAKFQAPDYLKPSESAYVNATIRNVGFNNETNIVVNFTVNGMVMDSTTITFLESRKSTLASFLWTPIAEGNYTVGIEVTPIPNENYTGNNQQSKIVNVRYIKGFVLFDQTHGTDNISYYSDWVDSLLKDGYVVDTYTAGVINSSIFSGYDVFVIPQARSTYTMDEISAVQSFVSNGGGLFVIGDDYPTFYSHLTGFAGIYWDYWWWGGTTTDITPHPITTGVSSIYLYSPETKILLSGNTTDLVRDPTGGIMLAVSEDPGRVAGFADENSLRNWGINQADNLILADNIIKWLVGIRYEHDIAVTNLRAPDYLKPNESAYVNATIRNVGLNNETNILVNFIVDGMVIDNTTISFLETRDSTLVSLSWTPMVEGEYIVSIEVEPIPNENYTGNNQQSKIVSVRYIKGFVLFDQTHGTDNILYYSDWVDSLLKDGYVVDTHTAGVINSSIFSGYDVFVIPQARSTYTMDEISAVQSFVSNGGGLFVIGDDYPTFYSHLTGFAGIYWDYWWGNTTTTDITPHSITTGVSFVYLDSPETKILLSGNTTDLVRDPTGGIMLAVSEDPGRVAGFADENSLQNWGINQADNLILADNIIKWLSDSTPPSSYVNVLPTYHSTLTFNISYTAVDNTNGSGLKNVTLYYNMGLGWTKNVTDEPPYGLFTFTAPSDGIYEFYTIAVDNAGNVELLSVENDTWTIVDTTKPTISFVSPSSGAIVTSSSVTITWASSDTTSGIDHYEIRIDDASYVNVGSETNYTFTGISDGSHSITIKVVDKAGNSKETTLNIKVDTNPFSLSGPYKGSPLYLIIILVIIICVVLGIWLLKRKKKEPGEEVEEEVKEEIEEEEAEEVMVEEEEAGKDALEETEVEKRRKQ